MLRVGRNREKHKRLPKGWAPSRAGVIYFRPTNAADKAIVKAITRGPLSLRLGADHNEAAETYARLVVAARTREAAVVPGTIGELVDRARRDYLPKIDNPETRAWRARHVEALGKLFGSRRYARTVHEATKAPGTFLMALDVQRHLDENQHRAKAANREAKTWSIVFAEARRRWGLTEYNPCQGLDFNPEPPREVLPDAAALFRVWRRLDPPMRFAAAMIRHYGRRRGEILRLTLSDAKADGLHFLRGKPRPGRKPKVIIIRWEPRLERAWARLMAWRTARVRGGKLATLTAALVNRKGMPYTATGFNSAWRRAQERAGVRGDFTFHDVRKKEASGMTLQDAQHLLAHDEQRTTLRYRVGAHVIDFTNDSRNSRKRKS
jgi:hypothetical protein